MGEHGTLPNIPAAVLGT